MIPGPEKAKTPQPPQASQRANKTSLPDRDLLQNTAAPAAVAASSLYTAQLQ